MSDSKIKLSDQELIDITGYEQATKQLRVLRDRGFVRAFINRNGAVVLERSHYEAVTRGEAQQLQSHGKRANLSIFKAA